MLNKTQQLLADREMAALAAAVTRNKREIRRTLKEMGRVMFPLSRLDSYRLLVLHCWTVKYKVSLLFVLETLTDYWGRKLAKRRKNHRTHKASFGVRIASFVGLHSEQVLQKAVAKAYPTGENIKQWRDRKRRTLLDLDTGNSRILSVLSPEHLRSFVEQYRERVMRKSRKLEGAMADAERRRRPYRDNPWL